MLLPMLQAHNRIVGRVITSFAKRSLATAEAATSHSASNELVTTFATPNEVYYEQSTKVKQVDIPTIGTGDMGILAKHVPAIAVLKPGLITFYEHDGSTQQFIASSGTAVVNSDSSLQILAEVAYPIDDFDLQACQEQLKECQERLDAAKTEIEITEAKIGLECADTILKEVSKRATATGTKN